MKNLMFCAYAYLDNSLTSSQVGIKASSKTTDIYMKNAYVTLFSAKLFNY